MAYRALKPGGIWVLSDIACHDTLRKNIQDPAGAAYFGFSLCLCMSCSLSREGGAGLGTMGFSVPLAHKMIVEDGKFESMEVLMEKDLNRYFVVRKAK